MTDSDARNLLLRDLGAVADALLAATGRWPVLLALVNGAARADLAAGAPVAQALAEILQALVTAGPTVLDVADPQRRHEAVAATLQVSLARLTPEQRERYSELAVFGEDVQIPRDLLARLWQHTGGWPPFQTHRFCQQLADLSLIVDYRLDPPFARLQLHDVVRAFLRHTANAQLPCLHDAVVQACRELVRQDGTPHASSTPWWRTPRDQLYVWTSIATHLAGAGLHDELLTCLHHPDYLVGKLETLGPAALAADLALADDPLTRGLHHVITHEAHLFAPLAPPGSLHATLASRLHGRPALSALAATLLATAPHPHPPLPPQPACEPSLIMQI